MKSEYRKKISYLSGSVIASFLVFFTLMSCKTVQVKKGETLAQPPQVTISGISPAEITDISAMRKGLAVTYYLKYFKRSLSYLDEMVKGEFTSFAGEPITHLDHQFGRNEVFNSGVKTGVALRMRGYLLFPQAGQYSMQALSNDGINVYLAGKLAVSDPKQHADRLSNIAHVSIEKKGWVPVKIDYFQRKGTATIKLLWKTPQESRFMAIPASHYGHMK